MSEGFWTTRYRFALPRRILPMGQQVRPMMPRTITLCDFTSHPFIESVGRNHAFAMDERIAKCTSILGSLRFRVDTSRRARVIPRP
jgi:hypothetical protein